MLLNARVCTYDCPTNGLDAANANMIVQHICDSARQSKGIAVTSLQQPSPELCAMFDKILLLSHGIVAYYG
jgi:ABC-type multidrug transport system ATPase subunit